MQATIISLQPNVTRQGKSGPYQVHLLKYQQDPTPNYPPKPPTERPIFTQNRNFPELAGKVLALQPGQRVELVFVPQASNSQFKDLSDVIVLGAAPQQQAPQQQQQYQKPPQQQPTPPAKDYSAERDAKDAARQASIQRQTCLKAAVEVVKTLIDRDKYYPAKIAPELLVDKVVFFADGFEAYLLGLNKTFEPDQGVTGEFQEPPIYNDDDEIPF